MSVEKENRFFVDITVGFTLAVSLALFIFSSAPLLVEHRHSSEVSTAC